ncbi:hypothetical protein EFK50_07385 [Nocardioides marmoriginsengisoli]|uniref:Uncharacterized protein n=1 Tax=Nocardioides marmoriginsengisoli TaxID=661483 RepID=A0A3N0CLM6_9ACTN|nr:hypothetical protein [Nocardioides marmoriginsengisoli]RNL64342.1 hypothetical protein EFK50_07385 [Nocardioides marmoriginsengisoli]
MTDQHPPEQDPGQIPGRIKDIRVYRDSFIGMIVLACIPFLIFGALNVYGWVAALALFVIWVLILLQGTRWFMTYPRRVVWLGVLAFACWLAVVVVARTT